MTVSMIEGELNTHVLSCKQVSVYRCYTVQYNNYLNIMLNCNTDTYADK